MIAGISDPTQSVRFVREREPGAPWEIGDRFSISWDGARLDLMCTGIRDGMLVEGWSEQLQAIISFDRSRP